MLVYKKNPKHKPGSFGDGPPRWFPDWDTPCPDDVNEKDAQGMLEHSVLGVDDAHPNRNARYAIDEDGRFFKAYSEGSLDGVELWHGYPVREERVREQVPARVLRELVRQGKLASARYKKLIGRAR
ncbi:MAG TPA: hypothetical protein VLS89_20430 [Candidatus Nanopelagicales bacterium]|nr:hypothetical protein [Candidatus Nanopelagicales bacterium]